MYKKALGKEYLDMLMSVGNLDTFTTSKSGIISRLSFTKGCITRTREHTAYYILLYIYAVIMINEIN